MAEATWVERWIRREIDRRQAETEAWATYVGQQSVLEFLTIMQGDGIHDIDEMARQYVANIPAMLDVEADDLPADLADLLAGYIRRQAAPVKPLPRVTREEWHATHRDFRCYINGQPYMLQLDPETGTTTLVPVEII